jgi:hypothetical protein
MEIGKECVFSLKVPDYLDGELPVLEASELDLHMKGCVVCSEILAVESEQRNLLRSLSTATLSPERYDAAWDRIESNIFNERSYQPFHKLILAGSFAFMLVFGIGIGFITKFGLDVSKLKNGRPVDDSSSGITDDGARGLPATNHEYLPTEFSNGTTPPAFNFKNGRVVVIPEENHKKLLDMEKTFNSLLERYNAINTQSQINWEMLNLMISKLQQDAALNASTRELEAKELDQVQEKEKKDGEK